MPHYDAIEKFRSSLILIIITGLEAPANVDLHGIPRQFLEPVAQSLIRLIEWKCQCSPNRKQFQRVVRWIQGRLRGVMEQRGSSEMSENFSKSEVEREVVMLLEHSGDATIRRVFYENRDDQELIDAFTPVEENLSFMNKTNGSYVLISDMSTVQDEESSFQVFHNI